jgi:hypothetical protein
VGSEECEALDSLCEWSDWVPLAVAARTAPATPGVYLARQGQDGPIVYVGMAGERGGQGLRLRLSRYASGRSISNGLGEAAADRALSDVAWLEQRLAEVKRGEPTRLIDWGAAAIARVDLYVRWTAVADAPSARSLEGQCGALCPSLWNRRAFTSSGPVANPPEPSERLEDVRPREASDAPGSSSGRVSARTTRAEGRQVRLTLHEAMKLVLSESGAGWMSAHALGRAISARGLYARGDGDIVRSGQIRARAAKYPHLFEGSRDGSNQVRLRRDA